MTLESETVRLRPPRMGDAACFVELLREPEVSRFFVWPPPPTLAAARYYIEGFLRENAAAHAYHFAVVPVRAGVPAGVINLYHLERSEARSELGIWLARSYWGTGLCRDACSLLLDFAFTSAGFEVVLFRVHPQNGRAQRAFERLGARLEGRTEIACQRTGAMVEHLLYALARAEWLAQRAEMGRSG
jgi:RimJ/RimL family protein N-acetyltransferase